MGLVPLFAEKEKKGMPGGNARTAAGIFMAKRQKGGLGLQPATLRKWLHKARARLQRLIVEKAEKSLQLELLPVDFASRCICRRGRSQSARKGGESG